MKILNSESSTSVKNWSKKQSNAQLQSIHSSANVHVHAALSVLQYVYIYASLITFDQYFTVMSRWTNLNDLSAIDAHEVNEVLLQLRWIVAPFQQTHQIH